MLLGCFMGLLLSIKLYLQIQGNNSFEFSQKLMTIQSTFK
jgi:hypothetical protein